MISILFRKEFMTTLFS